MISKSEAAHALREADRVHRRTNSADAYARASPYLVLAGLVWTAGYIATGLTPPGTWALFWAPLAALGALGSFVIAYRSHRKAGGDPAARTVHASRLLWPIAAVMAFIASTFLLFRPRELLPYLAFPALLMGLVYVLAGSFGLPRFRWIGGAMFALMILGLIVARESLAFWVAGAGGGGLILGGLWLRKA